MLIRTNPAATKGAYEKFISALNKAKNEGLPSGWYDDCKDITDHQMMLTFVNSYVNSYLTYRPDTGDVWKTPKHAALDGGDCEDYALAKYMLLKELGVNIKTMKIAIGENEKGEHHAVLYVVNEILDNRRGKFKPYFYVSEHGCYLELETKNAVLS